MALRVGTYFISTKIVQRTIFNVGVPSYKYSKYSSIWTSQCQFQAHHVLNKVRFFSSDIKKDNDTDKDIGTEIYNGPLSLRIRAVKLFSFSSSFMGMAIQPFLFEKIIEEGHNIGVLIFSGVIIQFFTFVTPFLFHYIGKRYVRKIYYKEETDEYVALTYNFFARDKLLHFKRDDVVAPDIPGMFTTWIVKGAPLFVEASHFDNIEHYKKLMGFDKPIDFKLYEKSTKE